MHLVATISDKAFAKRVEHYRRSFVRGRGRQNAAQAARTLHAAILTVRAELAALDLNYNANDLVRLSGEARRSREDMEAAYAATKAEPAKPLRERWVEEAEEQPA